jgi:5,5'-dehydrodivanillate O-demethylase
MSPPELPVPTQDVVPYYEAPIWDEKGEPVLDYVLAQDMVCWWSQGDITDRTQENLGVTDTAIVAWRNLYEAQIKVVEAGGDPMNTWRDPATMPDILIQEPKIGQNWSKTVELSRNFENNSDRYGSLMPEVNELSERLKEYVSGREK